MVQAKVSELARERETFRYEASLLSKSFINDTTDLSDAADLSSSSDTALTAFAQLGAMRLGGERCLISLFDQTRQHIVAEATPDSALGSNEANVLGHKSTVLLLSGTAIPRSFGVCEEVLIHDEMPPVPDGVLGTPSAKQRGVDLPVLVVRDLQTDERFNKRGWVRAMGHGFYAGVPIRSPRGINIGVYCVLGDKPRDGIDAVSIHFLQDMSQTIMSYLLNRATGKSFQRSVRMVRGLGSLVEGKASMSKWWLEDNPESFENANSGEGALNMKQQAIQRDAEGAIPMPPPLPRHIPPPSPLDSPSGRRDSSVPPVNSNGIVPNRSESRSDSISLDGSVGTDRHTPLSITDPTTTATYQREDESTIAIKSLFSKAANIIRESIEIEGVLFLDAVISSFGGLVVQGGEEAPSTSGESQKESFTSSGEESKEGLSMSAADVFCNVLGFSVGGSSSIDGEKSTLSHATVHEKFLKGLLRRYPEGHIFNFDESGAIQSGDSEDDLSHVLSAAISREETENGTKRRKPRRTEGDVLISMFSRARSVALIPLWDSHKERWFSGGFAWTRTPTRVLTGQGELSYLKALGMVVMSEVARINTLRADQAKADVLGSLSHELRSPLHGLILGAELLHDTSLDGFQEDVVLTIENCGRTLADTMDHLLDFSKVNHSVKFGGKNRNDATGRGTSMQRFTRAEAGPTSLVSDVNLASLAEEVVESVYAGFSFQKASNTMKAAGVPLTTAYATPVRRFDSLGTMDMFTRSSTPPRLGPVVSVHLHVDSKVDWGFHTQPGALRRIIMNLFGNALKYTIRGSINISLTQDSSTRTPRSRRRAVILTISDSGKGISAEYLRTQLFSPFAQEDHLAPGVGLGLSLVKQIISTLKGTISVDSEVGRGTCIRVTLPLRQSRPNSFETPTPAEADFLGQAKTLEGVQVRLLGFAEFEDADFPAAPVIGERLSPRGLVERICESWLRMAIFPESDVSRASPALYLCPEEALHKIPLQEVASQVPAPPVIVVCRNAVVAHELAVSHASTTRIFEYISQPAGPRKLAKVFTLALKRHAALIESMSKQPNVPLDTVDGSPVELITENEHPVDQVDSLSITPSTTVSQSSQTPNIDTPNGAVVDGATPVPAQQNKRSTFLLVDDNAINLKVLVSYMNKLERPFETAMNGLEALEAFRQNPQIYRCIFMDVSMPIMDGMEAARLIRAFEQQHNLEPVAIIALTGLGSSSTQEEAFASGIDLFLTKPVRLKELGRVLENYTI